MLVFFQMFYFLFMCLNVCLYDFVCLNVCLYDFICTTVGSAHGGQNRALDALGLELEASVGHHVGAGPALTSSVRTLHALNHSAISPASSP